VSVSGHVYDIATGRLTTIVDAQISVEAGSDLNGPDLSHRVGR
jgi:hypothetical protein